MITPLMIKGIIAIFFLLILLIISLKYYWFEDNFKDESRDKNVFHEALISSFVTNILIIFIFKVIELCFGVSNTILFPTVITVILLFLVISFCIQDFYYKRSILKLKAKYREKIKEIYKKGEF